MRRGRTPTPSELYYARRTRQDVPKRVGLTPERLWQEILTWKIRLRSILMLTRSLVRDSLTPMSAIRVAPDRWMNGVLTAMGLGMIVYFSYHSVAGSHGLFALIDLHERRDALSSELSLVRSERERFERRVDLLDQRRLDPDLLEESARTTLGYAHPDDLVIFRPSRPDTRRADR